MPDYFLLKPDGEQTGTYSADQIRKMLASGFIDAEACYWYEGMTEWKPVGAIDEPQFVPLEEASIERPPHPPRPLPGIQRADRTFVRRAARPPEPNIGHASLRPPRREPAPAIPPIKDRSAAPVELVTEPAASTAAQTVDESSAGHDVPKEAEPVIHTIPRETFPAERASPKPLASYAVYIIALALMALAIALVVSSRQTAGGAPTAHVTLTEKHTFVLLTQTSIRPFLADMQDTSSIDSLQKQATQATNPIVAQSLMIEIDKEKVRHVETVRDKYLRSHDAGYIDAGTYPILGYVDDNGAMTTPHPDHVWAAITYKDQVVFTYIPPAATPQ